METKLCSKCNQEKPVSEFWVSKRDGYNAWCIPCNGIYKKDYERRTGYHRIYQRTYSKQPYVKDRINLKKREYRQKPEVKIKNMARWYTNHEIRAGRINREPCAICGMKQAEAHHKDYYEPLLIVWLCPDCHRKAHLTQADREE